MVAFRAAIVAEVGTDPSNDRADLKGIAISAGGPCRAGDAGKLGRTLRRAGGVEFDPKEPGVSDADSACWPFSQAAFSIAPEFDLKIGLSGVYGGYESAAKGLSRLRYTDAAAQVEAQLDRNDDQPDRSAPLWRNGMPETFEQNWKHLKARLLSGGDSWRFWVRWYDGQLNGDRCDPTICKEIAKLPYEVWEAGPEAVAARIAQIEARAEVKRAIADLRKAKATLASDRLGIGGNFPPEPLAELREVARHYEIIWDNVGIVDAATNSEKPDKGRVEAALKEIKASFAAIGRWLASKGDRAMDRAIDWAVPTYCLHLLAHPEKISALIEAIEAWLPFH